MARPVYSLHKGIMTIISDNLQAVKNRLAQAAASAGRPCEDILLLAVSKTWPAQSVREANAAGQIAFGESYLQEALDKIDALQDLHLEWHFIGPIQSNKTRPIAAHFDWVHSVDRLKVAERLSQARSTQLPPLNITLQVNISRETTKSGVLPEEVTALAQAVQLLPGLKLRGLMTIPKASEDYAEQRAQFRILKVLMSQLIEIGLKMDTLSMGMSHDMEAAIIEGATIVRVGSAIFGVREKYDLY